MKIICYSAIFYFRGMIFYGLQSALLRCLQLLSSFESVASYHLKNL